MHRKCSFIHNGKEYDVAGYHTVLLNRCDLNEERVWLNKGECV